MPLILKQCSRDIDSKIQDKMYEQPALKTWGIFHGDRDAKLLSSSPQQWNSVCNNLAMKAAAPAVFPVKEAMNADSWKRELKSKLNDSV